MIKSELVARLTARYPHLYHRDVERIVTTVLESISKALADGHRVELRGFGAFSVKVRPSRMGRNPRTGETVSVGEERAAGFSRSQISRYSQYRGRGLPCRSWAWRVHHERSRSGRGGDDACGGRG